jgi:glutaminase
MMINSIRNDRHTASWRLPKQLMGGLLVATLGVTGNAFAFATGDLQKAVDGVYAKYKGLKDGETAGYIPELDNVDPELFGVVITTVDGKVYAAGDVDHTFSIQSAAKPFTAAMIMQNQGIDAIVDKIGVEPTGLPFNSVIATQIIPARSVNPLVNAGAIASVSMIKAKNANDRWNKLLGFYSDLAGEKLKLMDDVYQSESDTNYNNRAIGNLLFNYGRLYSDPMEAVDVYTKKCSVGVTTKQLSMMAATLANGGKNPKTGKQVLAAEHVPELLAIMMMAGFYDESGIWALTAGLPAKTGVGGGIYAVVPGKMSITAFSPRVNEAGNSVRAMNAIESIARDMGLGLFGANPK